MRRRLHARSDALYVTLDHQASVPLYTQIYSGIRDAIRSGRLAPGARIPSTRALSRDLAVSRTTALVAIGQLRAEGFLTASARSGTRVARSLPDELLTVVATTSVSQRVRPARRFVSDAGAHTLAHVDSFHRLGVAPRAFRPGAPALDQFPVELWARLAARRYQRLTYSLLHHDDLAGYAPLRAAIAEHVRIARGVRCMPDQVIITSGAQQAMCLAAQVLLNAGDQAWMEDPGYPGMRGVLSMLGVAVVPIGIDAEGIDVREGSRLAPAARMAYVTPSHQFPLGVTMSTARRRELLDWANDADAWILEDDYDSECRFNAAPLPALQGLDVDERVIYVGTFSKTVFPSLRIGYLVAPPDLVPAFTSARSLMDGHASPIDQAILADFITEGHFARHVRRMRALYAERQARLVSVASCELRHLVEVSPSNAGLHLLGWLPVGVSDRAVSESLAARDVEAPALSCYYSASRAPRGALVLGYGALDEHALRDGIRAVGDVVKAELAKIQACPLDERRRSA